MAMRWSRWVATRAAAETLAARAAAHQRALSSPSSQSMPLTFRPSATAERRSDSLTRNSSSPCISVSPFGEGGGDGQHRIFVDHRRRALRRHGHALQLGMIARANRRRPRRRRLRAVDQLRCRRPFPAASVISPVRVGFISTFSIGDVGARHDERGDQREGWRRTGRRERR